MNYYLDQEFIEGFKKPWFGKRRHFIDLISIGIVAEDGRELYLISNEYNYNDASDWVKENVILPLYIEIIHGDARNMFHVHNFHKVWGISNAEIAEKIKEFCRSGVIGIDAKAPNNLWDGGQLITRSEPVFYGYFASYDWVLFCSLFGRMINLPANFQMYCNDLKQTLDEKADALKNLEVKYVIHDMNPDWVATAPIPNSVIDITKYPLSAKLEVLKSMPGYPKQENEHSALHDARWNKKLHEFIKTL